VKLVKWIFAVGLVASCFCLLLVGATQRRTAEERRNDEVLAVLTAQENAWNEGKVDAFLDGYWRSGELTFASSQGISRGFVAVRERYQKNYPDRQTMGKLDFSQLEVHGVGPDAALVLGHWHLTREKGDIGGVFSLVLQRFPEGWRIIHDHTSVVPISASK